MQSFLFPLIISLRVMVAHTYLIQTHAVRCDVVRNHEDLPRQRVLLNSRNIRVIPNDSILYCSKSQRNK